jgi:hypothetical protein
MTDVLSIFRGILSNYVQKVGLKPYILTELSTPTLIPKPKSNIKYRKPEEPVSKFTEKKVNKQFVSAVGGVYLEQINHGGSFVEDLSRPGLLIVDSKIFN